MMSFIRTIIVNKTPQRQPYTIQFWQTEQQQQHETINQTVHKQLIYEDHMNAGESTEK